MDLERHGAAGTCYAGYHYDLNFLTIHGKSRFPGLAVWLQDGRRMPVSIPDGCLLIQAGKQIEWLTNGYIHGGMHEVRLTFVWLPSEHSCCPNSPGLRSLQNVMCWNSSLGLDITCCGPALWDENESSAYCGLQVICTEATQSAVTRAKAAGRVPCRVSSTVFAHIASDVLLQPIGRFASEPRRRPYVDMLAGEFVQQELEVIKLKKNAPAPC